MTRCCLAVCTGTVATVGTPAARRGARRREMESPWHQRGSISTLLSRVCLSLALTVCMISPFLRYTMRALCTQ